MAQNKNDISTSLGEGAPPSRKRVSQKVVYLNAPGVARVLALELQIKSGEKKRSLRKHANRPGLLG